MKLSKLKTSLLLSVIIHFNSGVVMAMPECEYGGYINRYEMARNANYRTKVKESHIIVANGKIVSRILSGNATISDDLELVAFELKNLEKKGICSFSPQNCKIGFKSYVTRSDFHEAGPAVSFVAVKQESDIENDVTGILSEVSKTEELSLKVAPITTDHYSKWNKYNSWDYITSPYNIGLTEIGPYNARLSTVLNTKALLDKMVDVGICKPYVPSTCEISAGHGVSFSGGIFGRWAGGSYDKSNEALFAEIFVESNICSKLIYNN